MPWVAIQASPGRSAGFSVTRDRTGSGNGSPIAGTEVMRLSIRGVIAPYWRRRGLQRSTWSLHALLPIAPFAAVFTARAGELNIAERNRSDYQIVVQGDALPATRWAASELQSFVEKATDARLPIVGPDQRGEASIVIRADAQLPCDGFMMEVMGRDLVITGGDTGGEPRTIDYKHPVCCGTLYGVYEFLERFAGVRFYWPDELGTIVPSSPQIEIPDEFRLAQSPHFRLRRLQYGPGFRNNREEDATGVWGRRLRLGASQPYWFNHNWWRVLDVEEWARKGRPEYAALVDGKRMTTYLLPPKHRGGFVCTGNPEVVDIFVGAARASEDPMFSASPNDNPGQFCECESCRKLDSGRSIPDGPQADKRDLSDRMVLFYNMIAERAARPVGGYAYNQYVEVPARTPLHANVWISLALNNAFLAGDPIERARAERLYRGWGNYSSRTTVYDILYFAKQMPDLIAPLGRDAEGRIRLVVDSGLAGAHFYIAPEMELGGADAYVVARMLWNPDIDPGPIRQAYYHDLYGHGWAQVQSLYQRAEHGWRDAVNKHGTPVKRQRAVQKLVPELRRDLEAAEKAAGENGAVRARLKRLDRALQRMGSP